MKKSISSIGSAVKNLSLSLSVYAAMYMGDALAAGDLTSSSDKIKGGLNAVKSMLPVGSQVLGFIVAGSGLYAVYKHHKSDGRDGSMSGGIAGMVIGVCLYALGGFLSWSGTSIGMDASAVTPPGGNGSY